MYAWLYLGCDIQQRFLDAVVAVGKIVKLYHDRFVMNFASFHGFHCVAGFAELIDEAGVAGQVSGSNHNKY